MHKWFKTENSSFGFQSDFKRIPKKNKPFFNYDIGLHLYYYYISSIHHSITSELFHYRKDATPVKIYGETTLIFPLLVAETFAREHHGLDK